MDSQKFYSRVSNLLVARNNCLSTNNEFARSHEERLEQLVKQYLPRGSGFDSGTKFVWEESNRNKLVFATAFHHMNEGGYYDGWTEHKVIITPDLLFGYNIKITGKNRNDIKEYMYQCFSDFDYKE